MTSHPQQEQNTLTQQYLQTKIQKMIDYKQITNKKLEEQRSQLEQIRIEKQLQQCTFHPKILDNADYNVGGGNFLDRQQAWNKSKEKKIARMKQMKLQSQPQFSFKPQIHKFKNYRIPTTAYKINQIQIRQNQQEYEAEDLKINLQNQDKHNVSKSYQQLYLKKIKIIENNVTKFKPFELYTSQLTTRHKNKPHTQKYQNLNKTLQETKMNTYRKPKNNMTLKQPANKIQNLKIRLKNPEPIAIRGCKKEIQSIYISKNNKAYEDTKMKIKPPAYQDIMEQSSNNYEQVNQQNHLKLNQVNHHYHKSFENSPKNKQQKVQHLYNPQQQIDNVMTKLEFKQQEINDTQQQSVQEHLKQNKNLMMTLNLKSEDSFDQQEPKYKIDASSKVKINIPSDDDQEYI